MILMRIARMRMIQPKLGIYCRRKSNPRYSTKDSSSHGEYT